MAKYLICQNIYSAFDDQIYFDIHLWGKYWWNTLPGRTPLLLTPGIFKCSYKYKKNIKKTEFLPPHYGSF